MSRPERKKWRRVVLVTGGRSDYGLVRPIAAAVAARSDMELVLYATGNHFSERFGMTIDRVKAEFPGVRFWNVFPDSTAPVAVGTGLGRLGEIVAKDFSERKPGVVVLVGDRIELLPVAQTCLLLGIPVAHVGGGETTLGAIDEKTRSCLTSIADLHFVSIPAFAEKVIIHGADEKRVFVVGETALDTILAQPDLSDDEARSEFGFLPDRKTLLITFHAETSSADFGLGVFRDLMAGLGEFAANPARGSKMIFTMPNADPGGEEIIAGIEAFVRADPERRFLFPSLGARRWVAAMRRVGAIVGNSSSGLLEAPSFGLPAVNIGHRQEGRLRAANVIDADGSASTILAALTRALEPSFRDALQGLENPYGDGKSGVRIAIHLADFLGSGSVSATGLL